MIKKFTEIERYQLIECSKLLADISEFTKIPVDAITSKIQFEETVNARCLFFWYGAHIKKYKLKVLAHKLNKSIGQASLCSNKHNSDYQMYKLCRDFAIFMGENYPSLFEHN